jgi:S-adenosylmethionine/arginine decarboxylase-like enzyme
MAWGYHLILDCYDADKELITDPKNIEAFAIALVSRIDMVAYGDPLVVHFGEGDKAGYTLVQLIETSNIVAHFCDESGNFYLDVFSCKPFATTTVLETVNQFFAPKKIRERYVERD